MAKKLVNVVSKRTTPKQTPKKIAKKVAPPMLLPGPASVADPKKCGQAGAKGSFVRKDSGFRGWVSQDKGNKFQPEMDRYHLYIAWACPWANRCAAVRHMKGLTKVIGLSVVHPTWKFTRPGQDEHAGWVFADSKTSIKNAYGFGDNKVDCSPEPLYGVKCIRDLYEMAVD